MRICLLIIFSVSLIAQTRYPSLPKYPMKGKLETTHTGVWPNAKHNDGDPKDAKFKRVEFQPPTLKLLVRANCGEQIGQKELIEKAKKITGNEGGVVEIDWKNVSDKDVVFYTVVLMEKRVTRYSLVAKDGTYVVVDSNVQLYPNWQVTKLLFPGGKTCVLEEDLEVKAMYITVANLLNRLMLPHLNSRVPD